MNLLALETSTEACAVGLSKHGQHVTRFALTPRRHTECVLPWSDELLHEAELEKRDLHAIAVGIGPGAFTGVRLGVSLAQGMALALSIPAIPVSTLAVVAQAARHNGPIAVVMDARMSECYVGFFQKIDGIAKALSEEQLLKPDDIRVPFDGEWIGVGSGFSAYREQMQEQFIGAMRCIDANALPQPEALLQLAEYGWTNGLSVAPEALEPAYLRNHVALTIEERQQR